MNKINCVVISKEIIDLSMKFQGSSPETTANRVGLWQSVYKSDEIPSAKELAAFLPILNKADAAKELDENADVDIIDLINNVIKADVLKDFTINTPTLITLEDRAKINIEMSSKTRRDRVRLISKLFSLTSDRLMEYELDQLTARINATENEFEKAELESTLKKSTKVSFIINKTPAAIFDNIKTQIFDKYIALTEQEAIVLELALINADEDYDDYNADEKLEGAKKKANYKRVEYSKIANNFKALTEECIPYIGIAEGVMIDPFTNIIEDEDVSNSENMDEEKAKDGWMVNSREVSSHESLSKDVKKTITELVKLDREGYAEVDDLDNVRYLDAEYVHAVLVDKLKDMVDENDFKTLLDRLEDTHPWISQIKEKLDGDKRLFSKFYRDFNKDFIAYWIHKKKTNPDGSYTIETVPLNKPTGIYYLLNEWRDFYESGSKLDPDSVYEKNGDINIKNAEKGETLVGELMSAFTDLSTEEKLNLIKSEEYLNSVNKVLNMLGINVPQYLLINTLITSNKQGKETLSESRDILLQNLLVIYKGIKRGELAAKVDSNGVEVIPDFINNFGTAYTKIAEQFALVNDEAIESSVREGGKSRYSHVAPNYMMKMIKNLKNVMHDEARFKEYIETNFKAHDWFHKDGEWKNGWLKELVESDNALELRQNLSHRVVLNRDKKEYADWDSTEYSLLLIEEYFSEPEQKGTTAYANYHIPILSDTQSAEFIKFIRYTNRSQEDEDGNAIPFEDIIANKMKDVVMQEFDRIMLVRKRALNKSKGMDIEEIANYDGKRGNQFCFIPELNDMTFKGGLSMIDKIKELSEIGEAETNEFIENTLKDLMEKKFKNAYANWADKGLFKETSSGKLEHFNSNGYSTKYKILLQGLTEAKKLLPSSEWTVEMERLIARLSSNRIVDYNDLTETLAEVRDRLANMGNKTDAIENRIKVINTRLNFRDLTRDKLKEYFYNSTYASSQIIQLLTTDLAYYKNAEDFQKRFKEVYAPSIKLDTTSEYGRTIEKTITLRDEEIRSVSFDAISAALDEKVKENKLSKIDRDLILTKYEKVNVSDAQAWRSLSSYRAVLDMAGQWTPEMKAAYTRFTTNTWDYSDFDIIWQTLKPYLYTQVSNESGVEGKRDIKTPVQHKNSEFLLLSMFDIIGGATNKSNKLKAINQFMEDHEIDLVQFESAVKVSNQGIIDLNNVNSYDEVYNELKNKTFLNGGLNPKIVHQVPYADYGIQTETPEHVIDKMQLIGTQIRKLIASDIADDAIISVNGVKKTKAEWIKEYNAVNTANIVESFEEVDAIFKDPKQVEIALQEQIRSDPRYGSDLLKACTLDDKGNFNMPLYDPVQSQRIQMLLNSIIKNRITKQKIKGGALIQVSNYGLTEDLNMVFKDAEGNLIPTLKEFKRTYNKADDVNKAYASFVESKGPKSIAYLECYMPAYSKKFYEPLMKPGTHELDVEKLPEDLRKLIGYRVPTEDKYSMAPLYIKGFLPQNNGSAIMLPSDITALSGSDFDVDKLYVMLPEFNAIKKYEMGKAWTDFYNENPEIVKSIYKAKADSFREALNIAMSDNPEVEIDAIMEGQLMEDYFAKLKADGVKNYDYVEGVKDKFKEFFNANKKAYYQKTVLSKIKYNTNKSAQDNNRKARNNHMIDLMFGALSNEDTVHKMLNPGGFDDQKKTARVINILQNASLSELRAEFNIERESDLFKALMTSSLEKLNKLSENHTKQIDPLSPLTQVAFHQQNMTGAALIGIYANHNSNHALMQQTDLSLSLEHGSFRYNRDTKLSLHSTLNAKGQYISRNNAGYLAASVDNVKDPVLAFLLQNTFTADAAMLMSRLGYEPMEVGMLMAQPIVRDISKAFFKAKGQGLSKSQIINDVIKTYSKSGESLSIMSYDNFKKNDFSIEDMAKSILIEKDAIKIKDSSQSSDLDTVNFYKQQVSVGFLFSRIMATSDALGDLVQATRADTQGGGAGPSIADTVVNMQKVEDFLEAVGKEKSPLIGASDIVNMPTDMTFESDLNDHFNSTRLPYLQAFTSLGVFSSKRFMADYFPYFNENVSKVVNEIKALTPRNSLDAKTVNSIYNDLLAYKMSKLEFFGTDENFDAESKFDYFANDFPYEFSKIKNSNPEIAELEFIKRIKFKNPDKRNPFATLEFKNVGNLSALQKENFMKDWETLLYMDNKLANNLAIELFRYSYFRNGFAFGPSSFMHLAPLAIRKAVPGYTEALKEMESGSDNFTQFIDQYVFNHLHNNKLVRDVPLESSLNYYDKEAKVIKDIIEFEIKDEISSKDSKLVQSINEIDGKKNYELFKYLSFKSGKNPVYYKMTRQSGNSFIYMRIEPLGVANNFLRYEYGRDAFYMETIVAFRMEKEDIKQEKLEHKVMGEYIEDDSDVDSNENVEAYNENVSHLNGLDNAAFEMVYGVPLNTSKEDKTSAFDSLEEVNLPDANNEYECK